LKKDGFWNLPNTLTVALICAVPDMVVVLWTPPGGWGARLACAIFAIAMITDIVDGYLARKWGLESVAGAFLDPLADKLMVVTTLVMLVGLGWLPAWLVAVMICRELTITGVRTIAVSEGLVLSASTLGKLKTAFQATALGFLLWHHDTHFLGLFWADAHACGVVLLYFALFFSLYSAGSYLSSFFRHAAAKAS